MLGYRYCHMRAVAALIALYWITRLVMPTPYRSVSGEGAS